jgi:hypothetical protein
VASLSQLPYGLDQTPADFFLYPRIKTSFEGHHLDNIEAIQALVTTALSEVSIEAF